MAAFRICLNAVALEWACGRPDIVVDNDLHIGCQSISNKGGYEYTNKIMVQ